MARVTDPKCRQCRREGVKLFLKGERCLTEKLLRLNRGLFIGHTPKINLKQLRLRQR